MTAAELTERHRQLTEAEENAKSERYLLADPRLDAANGNHVASYVISQKRLDFTSSGIYASDAGPLIRWLCELFPEHVPTKGGAA